MAEYFAGGHLRFVNGEWRDDDGNIIEISRVRHGRWISKNHHGYEWTFVCSNCDYVDGYPFNDRHNYCPNCGAKMDLPDECEQEVER